MSRRTSSDSEYVPRHHWESLAWTEYGMDAKLDVLMQVLPADLVEGPIARFFYHSEAVPHIMVMGGRSNQFAYHDESVIFDTFNERWVLCAALQMADPPVGGYTDSVTIY
ncbi:hypothetical protein Pmar_PMAR023143 [Perkinsus marinus ATCC 50983]|uniref:Kelch repeat protein n=1 Tax=Perkinsus marinus (strain ATCC 50983 / TXsc) TaxID=423536 RepID=C5LXF8_PERM5|nr:hypothetical protein Pmar_PMAR023143 [Perkinsus marinus ATCC 50983]EEQ98584.1 hypothetical protein Pmar_PMAR023143 [Perkinsus marinus ATCC 50983]|eukprot:XP_002765867.1 hypothetical protein Pmar_PMAR023143 [Perkinsus marinus ATCC 50983]